MNGAAFMKQKNGKNNYESNIIPFIKCAQKNDEKVTSTVAAILAIKIEHPKNISPEEFFIELIESFGKNSKQLTIETVKGFLLDSKKSKFKI